jgi:hypothetical protein
VKYRLMQWVGLALLITVLGACSEPGVSSTEIEVGEFWISAGDRVLRAGTIDLSIENYGEFPHTLVVSDAAGIVIAATDLIGPEAETALTVNLAPGSYMLTCRIVKGLEDGTVVDHYQEGMAASVDVAA